jgi:transposase
MRKTREILRQKWCLGHSHREVARSLGQSVGAIHATLRRATDAGLDWEALGALSDEALDARLYGAPAGERSGRILPDFAVVHAEHKRPGVTIELLHLEYLEQHPGGYLYTQFCEYYRRWLKRRRLSMRQIHRAGEKLFIDYAGQQPQIVDRATGEVKKVELFVAVLGASSFTYAEATATQRVPDFLASHVRTFEFIGGVAAALVPDQLKSAITRACRYEPGAQRAYEELAQHYGTAILPARPAKPRDKAKVEVAVQVAERWILARLRNEIFFSLAALNLRIRELLAVINARTMRAYGASRQELFERLDRPALKPLPVERFEHAEWKAARVNLDYHVELDHHYYSVPHALVHERVELRFTAERRARAPHNDRRAHAEGASEAPDLDALAADPLGGQSRARNGDARRGDPRRPPAPGAGLPLVPGDPAPGQALRARAARSRLRASRRRASPLLPPCRLDPEARPRPLAAAGARSRPRARGARGRARERARRRLLPTRSERRRIRCSTNRPSRS